MMQTMRNSAKIVFFIVLIAFAGFMILQGLTSIFSDPTAGGRVAPPGVIGEIDGIKIPLTYFENAYRSETRALLEETEEPSDEELQRIRDQIWNNLTTVTILELEAGRRGITVSDAEVVEYMRLSPPQELLNLNEFKTDGVFDIMKYQDWLRQAAASGSPEIVSFLANFESQIRQQLTLSRLQDLVISMVRTTPVEIRNDIIEKNEKVKVRYIYIPRSDFQDSLPDPPESELRAKFSIDKEKYREQAKASFSYVEFPKRPGEEVFEAVRVRIDSLRQELLAGADFADMAKEVSDDVGSGQKGGDLNWFGEGRMVAPFWEATTRLAEVNDISEPVRTQFGWHLIKLTGKRAIKPDTFSTGTQYEYRASHILLRVETTQDDLARLEELANSFAVEAAANGFAETARDFELEILETDEFTDQGYPQALGRHLDFMKFAFNAGKNDISKVISARNSFVVCSLPKVIPSQIPPFEDVKERVKESYLYDKRIDAAFERAEVLATEFESGKSFDEVVEIAGKEIKETDFFARHEIVPGVGSDPDFVGAAFALSADRPLSGAVRSRSGAFLIEFVERQAADLSLFEAKADSLVKAAADTKLNNFWPRYVNTLKNNADIVDYRSYYYGD
jgi:peptidyl-prolyl cis-trans isomerase D